jgi:hypothetical protein
MRLLLLQMSPMRRVGRLPSLYVCALVAAICGLALLKEESYLNRSFSVDGAAAVARTTTQAVTTTNDAAAHGSSSSSAASTTNPGGAVASSPLLEAAHALRVGLAGRTAINRSGNGPASLHDSEAERPPVSSETNDKSNEERAVAAAQDLQQRLITKLGSGPSAAKRTSPAFTWQQQRRTRQQAKKKRQAQAQVQRQHARPTFYSVARTDRAGASLIDMVTALAYGYVNNSTYRGACYRTNMTVDAAKRQADKLALIRTIGLQDTLVYACPPPSQMNLIVPRTRYYDNRYALVTSAFIRWLRSQTAAAVPKVAGGSAVVHVRRGDVDPCKQWKDRYLPNSYYQDVLQKYVPSGVPVTVFSESASFEPFSDFINYKATLRLDTGVAEVWEAVMAASHIVLSKSSFAYVPALLNAQATVIYPAEWPVVALSDWRKVDADIQESSLRRTKVLAKQRCRNYTSVRSGRSFYNASKR